MSAPIAPPSGLHAEWTPGGLQVGWTPSGDTAVAGYAINLSVAGGAWYAAPWIEGRTKSSVTIPGLDQTKRTEVRIRSMGGSSPSSSVAVAAVVPPPPPPPPPPPIPPTTGAGTPRYQWDFASWADSIAIPANAAFFTAKAHGMHARYYPPFGNSYPTKLAPLKLYPYLDAWTHNSEHGESGAGRFRLADPKERAAFLAFVIAEGAWLDDWQFAGGHRPTDGELPLWNEAQTLTVEELRAKYPGAYITTNTHWFEVVKAQRIAEHLDVALHDVVTAMLHPDLDQRFRDAQPHLEIIRNGRTLAQMIANKEGAGEPFYDRCLRAMGAGGGGSVFEEWGFGRTAGIRFGSPASYKEILELIEWRQVVYGLGTTIGWDYSEGTHLEPLEWDRATLLLVDDGRCSIDGGHQTPSTFMALYDMDLGDALGPRKRSTSGVWSREFTNGQVFTVEPGAATQTIQLPKSMKRADGSAVTQVTLAASQGAVLSN